jgi:sugar phosphate permease
VSHRNRWIICLFVFLATVLNYMDRQTLGIVGPLIEKEFHLDNAQLGILFSAFYFTYGCSVAVIGELLDRISVRVGFALILTWWSLATALTGLSRTFTQLLGFRMALGAGEAGLWPGTARLMSMYLPPQERTLGNSIYMGGGSLGLVLVQPVVVWLSLRYGWRAGFVVIGSLSAIWIAAWLWWFRPHNISGLKRYDELAAARGPISWREIIKLPRFWGLLVASLFGNACLYFLMNWIPTFLVQDRHFAFNMTLGGALVLPYLGLDLGYLVSGFVVLHVARRGVAVTRVRRLVVIGSATLMAASMIMVPLVGSNSISLLLLFTGALGMAGFNSNYLCFVEELSPHKVAAVAGVVGSAGAFAGALSLWLIGLISQVAGSFTLVFAAVGAMIWIASLGLLLTPEPSTDHAISPIVGG